MSGRQLFSIAGSVEREVEERARQLRNYDEAQAAKSSKGPTPNPITLTSTTIASIITKDRSFHPLPAIPSSNIPLWPAPDFPRGPMPVPAHVVPAARRILDYQLPPPPDYFPPYLERYKDNVRAMLERSIVPSTQASYGAGIQQFINFAWRNEAPLEALQAPDEVLIVAYVSTLVGRISGRTIRAHVTAIRAWQHQNLWVPQSGAARDEHAHASARGRG